MDSATFEAADGYIDQISELLDRALDSPECNELKRALAQLSAAIGDRYAATFSCVVEVFDGEKERTLPLLNMGLACAPGNEPYKTWADSTPHKYVADGEMLIVPHDRCPCCWEEWDFKFMTLACRKCGMSLGRDVKILLDSDICPHCEDGHVSASEPVCTTCGFEVDPSVVVWG